MLSAAVVDVLSSLSISYRLTKESLLPFVVDPFLVPLGLELSSFSYLLRGISRSTYFTTAILPGNFILSFHLININSSSNNGGKMP